MWSMKSVHDHSKKKGTTGHDNGKRKKSNEETKHL